MEDKTKTKKTKEELEREIEVYKKNNKALCDMMTLYSYCVIPDKSFDLGSFLILDEVIEDLEDPDVIVPFYGESIEAMFNQDSERNYKLYHEAIESGYFKDSDDEFIFREDYRTHRINTYFKNHLKEEEMNNPFDLISYLCRDSVDFISELLCSNIRMSRKTVILARVLNYFVRHEYKSRFEHVLDTKGAGMDLSRTIYTDKEKKIAELLAAFKKEMDRKPEEKNSLLKIILNKRRTASYYPIDWICYLQDNNIVDFMTIRSKSYVDGQEKLTSICSLLKPYHLENFKKFYESEGYKNIREEIRFNDDTYILENLDVDDIAEFISLPNYQTNIHDIDIIGKRVFDSQLDDDKIKQDLIDEITYAIIHKAKNKKEYAVYRELVARFEKLADYASYKIQQENALEQQRFEEERAAQELQNAYQNLYMRLYNMNESLQEQVPAKKVIKELTFVKPKQEE